MLAKILFFIVGVLLLLPGVAQAATTTAVTVITGTYPTLAGTSPDLRSNVVSVGASVDSINIDIVVDVSAASGTVNLICFNTTTVLWLPIGGAVTISSAVTGGITYARFTPGASQFSRCAIWEASGTAVIDNAWIIKGSER